VTNSIGTRDASEWGFHGAIIGEGDPEYEEARLVFTRAFVRRPALILRCLDVDDVVAAVRYVRATGLPSCVRSGGHSYAGFSSIEGGAVIDLAALNRVEVDAQRKIASIEGGALVRDVIDAVQPHGLVLPTGLTSIVGFAGLALGGGLGWMARKFGMTCDTIVAMDVVTATGEVVRASATENPDLFWAIRGGTGNFGIVTRLECRLFDVPAVTSGWLYFDLEHAQVAMETAEAVMREASNDLMMWLYVDLPASAVSSESERERRRQAGDERVLGVRVVYTGDPSTFDDQVREMRSCAPPLGERFEQRDYYELHTELDELQKPWEFGYQFSAHARNLSPELIREIVAMSRLKPKDEFGADGRSTRLALLVTSAVGGAAGELSEDAMAYPGRAARWALTFESTTAYPEQRELYRSFGRATYRRLAPHLDLRTSYVNLWVDTEMFALRDVYGDEKFEKLRAVKRDWDPDNIFFHNANIAP
jgi:FAD/FMN-containing dehydrogenase